MMKLNNKAFTLIETLMSVLIISIAIMGVSLLTTLMSKSTVKLTNKNSFDSMKYDLVSSVFTPQAWRYTLNNTSNPSLEGFRKNTDCRGQGGQVNGKLVLYDASGTVFYNSTSSTTGFTKTGAVCNNFDADSTDANCPVRFNIYWEPICPPTGACIKPRVKVFGRAVQNKSTSFTNLSETEFKNFDLIPEELNDLAPVAVSDIFYVQAGGTLTNVDVLTNDKYIKSENVSIELQKTTSDYGATISINSDKKISAVYSSIPNFHGLDKFTYKIKREDDKYTVATVWVKVMHTYTWTGDKSDVWNDPANWCGTVKSDFTGCEGQSAKPTTTSILYFDETCSSTFTCVPTTNENIEVNGVVIKENGFRQGSGFTISIGRSLALGNPLPATLPYGFHMTGGQFFGGNNKITINQGAPFNIAGGTFNSTSDVLELGRRHGNRVSESSGIKVLDIEPNGNFVHNGGTLRLKGEGDGSCSHKLWILETSKNTSINRLEIDAVNTCTGPGFYPDVVFKGQDGGKFQVANQLNHIHGLIKGEVYLSGDLVANSSEQAKLTGATATSPLANTAETSTFGKIILNGASNQKYIAEGPTATTIWGIPAFIVVDKPAGTTVSPSNITFNFHALGIEVKSGTLVLSSGRFEVNSKFGATQDLFIVHNGGQINHNNGTFVFVGKENNSCDFKNYGLDFKGQKIGFYVFELNINNGCRSPVSQATLSFKNSSIVFVAYKLSLIAGAYIGTIELEGDLEVANSDLLYGDMSTDSLLKLVGNKNQKYTFGLTEGMAPMVEIDKNGGSVTADSTTRFRAYSLKLTNGQFTAPSNGNVELGPRQRTSVTFDVLKKTNSATYNHSNSKLVITGKEVNMCGTRNMTIDADNLTLYDLEMNTTGTCANARLNVKTGQTLKVSRNLDFVLGELNGSYEIAGSYSIKPGARGGNAIIKLVGDQNQNLAAELSADGNTRIPTGAITIEKNLGTSVILGSNLTLSSTQNLNITSGTLSLNGRALSLGGTLTIGAQGTLDASVSGSTYSPDASPRLINNGTIVSQPMTSNTQ